jgi:hypothetical protein
VVVVRTAQINIMPIHAVLAGYVSTLETFRSLPMTLLLLLLDEKSTGHAAGISLLALMLATAGH